MEIQLNLYASLNRYLPDNDSRRSRMLKVREGTRVQDLLDQIKIPMDVVKIIFVNGVHASGETILKDGDRLGVFPPVAGG
jgi:molybdopterin synthase sulfur carrier subunit